MFQQISPRKIAFAEHVPVEHSVSVAFHETKSRQHSNDETTGCIGASHGVELNFLDSVSTEWRLYQQDADIPLEWVETPNGHVASVDEVTCSHTEGWSG